MKRQLVCPACGREFTARRVTQKYCSTACRLWAYRHRPNIHASLPTKGKILRTFRCLRCGEVVSVRSAADKRTKFCSPHCERLYWKHSKTKGVKSQSVSRTFRCRQCGRLVKVTEPKDRRMAFCSNGCRERWVYENRSKSRQKNRKHEV
ncbi:hypothetical protein E0L13_00880 [Megasphaera sp. SW808]|uniref:hypothetical protein n=1 Tax=Megasphaera sp. SW808 TaxID=2530045 RepID=UPI0014395B4E|nr:hypothetical protein [Megasphaera sp. SW808]NJE33583.1 hypothetical protein [Megasphaera sp. SW808]